jgi:alpha,alpha-trehalase
VDEGSVVSALLQSGLVMDGGVVTTLNNNTQQWDFPNAWAPLQWMLIQGIDTAEYMSMSTLADFRIYNSSALPPHAPPMPPSACDIVRPESWFNCTALGGCAWCFPSGPDISDAMGMRWLLGNYLAFNHTGYMLEKYYAPVLGGAGAGGEYQLQKGFGWTNGVALHLLVRYGMRPEFQLERLLETDYPFAHMAAFVDVSPMLPPHPPVTITSSPIEKEAEHQRATLMD